MSENEIVEAYFPKDPAEPAASAEEQATDPGGDLPGAAGVEAPPQETWAGPTQQEWEQTQAAVAGAVQLAEQQRLAAAAAAWADRVGPDAVNQWVQEQHWAQADLEHQQALEQQQLGEAEQYAYDYVDSIVEASGFDDVDTTAILELANEVVPQVVAELGAGPDAAVVALKAAAEAVLAASPEGQGKAATEWLVGRFTRGRGPVDVGQVVAEAGGKIDQRLVEQFGEETAFLAALYDAAGGSQDLRLKWTTIDQARREIDALGKGSKKDDGKRALEMLGSRS